MAELSRLFNRFFKIKTRKLHIILFFQLIAALACAFFTYYEVTNWHIQKNLKNNVGLIPEWTLYFVILAFLVILFVFILTPLQSEKFNRSQTWRSAGISDSQFYLDNVLSTFVSFIYMLALEVVAAVVISFFNFASQSIIDFVPANVNGALVKILHLFIIFVLIWFFFKIQHIFVYKILLSVFNPANYGLAYSSDLPFAILSTTICNLILLGSNVFLFNHFYEASERK